jgi:starch phosphorylase
MVHEYMTELYEPAHTANLRMRKADYALSREKAGWNAKIREVWDRIRFVDAGAGPSGPMISGKAFAVSAVVDLAGLAPTDVRTEVILGRVDSNGHLEETEVIVLPFVEQRGATAVFSKDIMPERTGRLGYALRVSPNHYDDPITRPCASLIKWSTVG